MRKTGGEWIVIANLMSAMLAVVIVMWAFSMLQRQSLPQSDSKRVDVVPPIIESEKPQEQPVFRTETQQQRVTAVLGQMESAFAQQGASSYVAIDAETGKVTLKERAFRRGSACIEPEAKAAFAKVEGQIMDYLRQFQSGRIYVEGHTDDKPVKAPVTDHRVFCAVYDDNFTLSAARAREARLLLIGRADNAASKRVIVAGYGDSQPLPNMEPGDERNRRVELRFVNGVEQR